jgi:lipoate-protein ligase A
LPPGWRVERATGSATDFHARPLEQLDRPTVHVWTVDRPALVLGSTQPDTDVDVAACAAAGVEVVRRRSGGGAVLLDPGAAVWVDVELPRGHERWDDDVGRATWWVGERWCAALRDAGQHQPGMAVHRGGMVTTPWSRLVCFAGLGPGEVTDGTGAKVVGISQRRTRFGARFQCVVPLAWDPVRLAGLLAVADRQRLTSDLAGVAAPVAVDGDALVDRFLEGAPAAPQERPAPPASSA